MKPRLTIPILLMLAIGTVALVAVAQRGSRPRDFTAELVDRGGAPIWETDPEFKNDVFTFVRIRYTSYGGWRRGGGKWATDYPDADLNFSYRLQELTSLEVDPHGKVLELTDPELFDYPFIYIVEPGQMDLTEGEVLGLRQYLSNGGFLMVDDFWGENEWFVFYQNIKRVFPDREPVDLTLEHEIFHCVYDLNWKPQVPSIHAWYQGLKTERHDAPEANYRALFDDKGRMMAIICHNTDLADGWEREGMDQRYFEEYAEKWAYPMGINIIAYAMTH